MIDHYQQSIFDGTEQSMYNQSIELIKTFEEVALHGLCRLSDGWITSSLRI